jgi:ribosomal protein L37AE/L43A
MFKSLIKLLLPHSSIDSQQIYLSLKTKNACFKYPELIKDKERRDSMSYCPKCGNKIDVTMTFCPHCGASLKGTTPTKSTPPPQLYQRNEKNEKQEKHERDRHPEKGEKQEKGETGFMGFLIGGLILIIIGIFSILNITNNYLTSGQDLAIMLFIIGIIIIVGAVYVATTARKRFPATS